MLASFTTTIDTLQKMKFDFGMNQYPIWSETARPFLNSMLLDHYRFREIGLETPELFKWFLNQRMDEIMGYYVELWETTKYKYDPLNIVNIEELYGEKTTAKNKSSGTSDTDTAGTSTNHNDSVLTSLYSDTPQTIIDNELFTGEQYLSRAQRNRGDSDDRGTTQGHEESMATSQSEGEGNRNYSRRRIGNSYHDPGEIIKNLRANLLNIPLMIITDKAISDLFLNIYEVY